MILLKVLQGGGKFLGKTRVKKLRKRPYPRQDVGKRNKKGVHASLFIGTWTP